MSYDLFISYARHDNTDGRVTELVERIADDYRQFSGEGLRYCAPCKGVGLQWVQFPPGNWVAPAGSYRSGGGGHETVGAFETDVSLLAMQRAGRP
jgi:hypothetical protein